jgi:tetratricopeptide (TPR) repeat protein
MDTPIKPPEITRGRKIVHFCNYGPLDSGMYKTVRDLVYEELRLGYEAWVVDTIARNPLRTESGIRDSLLEGGRVIGIEDDRLSEDADLICWHSWIPEEYRKDRRKNLVMFLHGMPSFVFYNELYNIEPVLSFLTQAYENLTHCHYYITLWPSHEPYWRPIFKEKLIVTSPWISLDSLGPKSADAFDPNHMRLVVMDTWRGGKEPYYIIQAALILLSRVRAGALPFRVTLDIYGQGVQNVQPVWHTLIPDEFKASITFRGKDLPENIFDTHDILLTQIGDESHIVREGLLSGMPILSGYPYTEWTPFRHDCRDIVGFADEILRCWGALQNREKRLEMMRKNRDYAFGHFDISQNSAPIVRCYEKIFEKRRNGKGKKSSLSLCMIVKNEEEHLPVCLRSVRSLVDEIILVDTGSTDRTVEIAESFGARVIDHPWQDDFSGARNMALEHAASDWILVLDADEVLAPEDLPKIRALIEDREVSGYRLIQRTYQEKTAVADWQAVESACPEARGYSGYIPSPLVRLFRRNRDIRFRGRVHEVVEFSILEMGGRIQDTRIPIHHYGKTGDEDDMKRKQALYRRLGERKTAEDPNDFRALYDLGVQYAELREYEEAEKALRKALDLSPGHIMVLFNLGASLSAQDKIPRAIEAYRAVLKQDPRHIGASNNLAALLEKIGEFSEAEDLYCRAIDLNPGHYVVHYNLGTFLRKQGRYDESIREYREALSLEPDWVEARFSLGIVWYEKGDSGEAARCFKRVLEIDPLHEEAKRNLEVLNRGGKASGQLWKDADPFEQVHAGIASAYEEIERIRRLTGERG